VETRHCSAELTSLRLVAPATIFSKSRTSCTCLLGPIVYERAYYHCRHCHRGHFPTDRAFGIADRQTPGAREVVTLAGVLEPFEHGARSVLPRMAGLSLSASTVQRTTETVGEDVARRRAAGETFGSQTAWDWHPDAAGARVAQTPRRGDLAPCWRN
jgi:hypothetical protein